MFRYALAYLMLCTASVADIATPKTLADTLRIMHDAYAQQPQLSQVEINFEERYLRFSLGDGASQFSFPDTLHIELQQAASDAERAAIVDRFTKITVQSVLAVQMDAPVALANVLPVLRHISYAASIPFAGETQRDENHEAHEADGQDPHHADLDGENTSPPAPPLRLPFLADIGIFLVEDAPQFVKFLTEDDLLNLNMTAEEVLIQARTNLIARASDVQISSIGNLHVLQLDGHFENSVLLLDSFWQEQAERLGPIVALVAARDFVVFTQASDTQSITRMRIWLSKDDRQISHPISETFLLWRDGAWSVFAP